MRAENFQLGAVLYETSNGEHTKQLSEIFQKTVKFRLFAEKNIEQDFGCYERYRPDLIPVSILIDQKPE